MRYPEPLCLRSQAPVDQGLHLPAQQPLQRHRVTTGPGRRQGMGIEPTASVGGVFRHTPTISNEFTALQTATHNAQSVSNRPQPPSLAGASLVIDQSLLAMTICENCSGRESKWVGLVVMVVMGGDNSYPYTRRNLCSHRYRSGKHRLP
jgi:hypothetical protein